MRMTLDAELTYLGRKVDTSPASFGELRSSIDVLQDPMALTSRMTEDGYLFLPGLLNRDDVLAAREEILKRLDSAGYIDRSHPLLDAIPSAEVKDGFVPQLATDNEPLEKIIFHGPMMSFYKRFLGGPVRHFDFVWLRAKRPGLTDATPPLTTTWCSWDAAPSSCTPRGPRWKTCPWRRAGSWSWKALTAWRM